MTSTSSRRRPRPRRRLPSRPARRSPEPATDSPPIFLQGHVFIQLTARHPCRAVFFTPNWPLRRRARRPSTEAANPCFNSTCDSNQSLRILERKPVVSFFWKNQRSTRHNPNLVTYFPCLQRFSFVEDREQERALQLHAPFRTSA
jgi:hypothetical protein